MIDILLPIYNGERFLKQLLDSILSQTYTNWQIIVRDDCSSDGSMNIIRNYQSKYPHKIIVVEDSYGNQGTSGCNNLLLQEMNSDYFMFCDQDDIWENKKIEILMEKMKEQEYKYPQIPIMICSDACCIDDNNNLLCSSFFENQKFCEVTGNVHKLLALNVVQGSTTLMNRKVKETIKYIPNDLFHDWWTAVNVAYYGKVCYIHKQLIRYRQHQHNVVGALDIGVKYHLKKLSNLSRQLAIYLSMYRQLSFKPSVFLWIYYKITINLKRL